MQPDIRRSAPALAPPAMIGGEIPLIDVGDYLAGRPGAAKRAAAELRYAFENVGFYYGSSGNRVGKSNGECGLKAYRD